MSSPTAIDNKYEKLDTRVERTRLFYGTAVPVVVISRVGEARQNTTRRTAGRARRRWYDDVVFSSTDRCLNLKISVPIGDAGECWRRKTNNTTRTLVVRRRVIFIPRRFINRSESCSPSIVGSVISRADRYCSMTF